jgi:methylenetetrahydrofolate reductase (NADPH)
MKADSALAQKIASGDFIVTAEYLPHAGTDSAQLEAVAGLLKTGLTAVNVSDNHYGVAMSSLAASVGLSRKGVEPVLQVVTRDRNRIALQSDLLGAAFLGIKNVLCLSGYHQTLIGIPESANVFDIDSIQLVAAVKAMNEGKLLNGDKIEGNFTMLVGVVANPSMKPLELNILRLKKKIAAGADFIQTQAVFDAAVFQQWLEAAQKEGLTEKTAILAGVLPLASAEEANRLAEIYTDYNIPAEIIERLQNAGDHEAQKKEGIKICADIIKKLKDMQGLRGVHILSGGNEAAVPELLSAAGL